MRAARSLLARIKRDSNLEAHMLSQLRRVVGPALLLSSLLGLGALGCSGNETTKVQRSRLLSDLDRDGLFASQECDTIVAPNGAENNGADCLIVPGPDECYFIGITEEGYAGEGDGDEPITGGDGWNPDEQCMQCYDADGQELGELDCGVAEDPIACDVLEERPDGTVCWECLVPDSGERFDECYTPPVECTSDADCPAGETCVIPETGECDAEPCPLAPVSSSGICVSGTPEL